METQVVLPPFAYLVLHGRLLIAKPRIENGFVQCDMPDLLKTPNNEGRAISTRTHHKWANLETRQPDEPAVVEIVRIDLSLNP